eukprot:gene21330-41357_t
MLDDIKKTLWASADKLRANMDAAEYKHLVLGLIFVKYISDAFVARQSELKTRLRDPADELFYGDAADEDIAAVTTLVRNSWGNQAAEHAKEAVADATWLQAESALQPCIRSRLAKLGNSRSHATATSKVPTPPSSTVISILT